MTKPRSTNMDPFDQLFALATLLPYVILLVQLVFMPGYIAVLLEHGMNLLVVVVIWQMCGLWLYLKYRRKIRRLLVVLIFFVPLFWVLLHAAPYFVEPGY